MNEYSELYNAIGNIGFPITIALYLLIRFEKKIDTLRQKIDHLEDTINQNTYRKVGDNSG